MSEEILNENIEEMEEDVFEDSLIPKRKNHFCIISKETFGDYAVHDIQTNGAWSKNPYGESYVVVPDDMVEAIRETRGFCDIELSEDGTEVVAFTVLEIPEIPEPEAEPTPEERITFLETQMNEMTDYQAEMLYELSLMQLGIPE